MDWAEVLKDKSLQDLPYKIELNSHGQIVMSPASLWHSNLQMKIGFAMRRVVKTGRILPEAPIKTRDNVKAPDMVWASDEFMKLHGWGSPMKAAPEICVEVLSPSNRKAEIEEKRALYFEKGAKEVWICSDEGTMSFYDPKGEIKQSKIFKKFPKKIDKR